MKYLYLIIFIITFSYIINAQETGTFTDSRDGKTYKTVKIGNQVWMAESLNFETKDSWCYNHDTTNCKKHGRLYIWKVSQNICPPGWHLPSKEEFLTLLNNVGGQGKAAYNSLKPGGNSGFSAPFGVWDDAGGGDVGYFGETEGFWSSSSDDEKTAWELDLGSRHPAATMGRNYRWDGLSVRCLQD